MRILMTVSGPWGTGAFNSTACLATEFIKLGHQVKIAFPDGCEEKKFPIPKDQHMDLYEIWQFPLQVGETYLPAFPLMIPDPHPRNITANTLSQLSEKGLSDYFTAGKEFLQKTIQEFKPDVIEVNHIWTFGLMLQELGYPIIYNAHHSDQLAFKFDTRMQERLKKSAQKAQCIFAISPFVKEEVVEFYGARPDNTHLMVNGFHPTYFKPAQVDRNALLASLNLYIPEEAHIYNCVGKISRTKGVDILINAYKQIASHPNIHLLYFGAGDLTKFSEYNTLTEEERKRIHFLGHQDQHTIAAIHNISRASIIASRSEGFGISGLEAMACSIPLITTRSGGPETFAIGRIVAPGDPAALAHAILEIDQLPEAEYESLCKKAHETTKDYTWEGIARKRLEHYMNLSDASIEIAS